MNDGATASPSGGFLSAFHHFVVDFLPFSSLADSCDFIFPSFVKWCGLLVFSSLVPLVGVFPLFIYSFIACWEFQLSDEKGKLLEYYFI
jgi:hypothetical protein